MSDYRKICTKERPMPMGEKETRWVHPDAIEGEQDDYGLAWGSYANYRCPNCGLRFKVQLPD